MRMRQITIARQDWISRSQGGNPMGQLKDGTQETGTVISSKASAITVANVASIIDQHRLDLAQRQPLPAECWRRNHP